MHAHDLAAPPAASRAHLALLAVHEPGAAWAARALDVPVPPDGLGDARARRDELRRLLSRERDAAADFLLALADFDRRRGWERLGHASLFSFLTRELGLSAGAAQLRLSAARLLPRHPAVEAALRDGRLCLSAAGQLARVLTVENEREVLPRFFGCSSREAMEVAAAILPAPAPPRREVVTAAGAARGAVTPMAELALAVPSRPADGARLSEDAGAGAAHAHPNTGARASAPAGEAAASTSSAGEAPAQPYRPAQPTPTATPAPPPEPSSGSAPLGSAPLHAHEVDAHGRAPPPTRQVVPLTADLRRLHLTVTAGFLDRVAKARAGLSHALPGATTEQVLEAALDALLEKQSRRRAPVRRPRVAAPGAQRVAPSAPPSAPPSATPAATPSATPSTTPAARSPATSPPSKPLTRPTPPAAPPATGRVHVPAAVEREVRRRDGDRCQFPLDAGGVCGSTWRVELDHVVPVALGGETSVANLRCLCRKHNQAAALEALGAAAVGRWGGRVRRGAREASRRGVAGGDGAAEPSPTSCA